MNKTNKISKLLLLLLLVSMSSIADIREKINRCVVSYTADIQCNDKEGNKCFYKNVKAFYLVNDGHSRCIIKNNYVACDLYTNDFGTWENKNE